MPIGADFDLTAEFAFSIEDENRLEHKSQLQITDCKLHSNSHSQIALDWMEVGSHFSTNTCANLCKSQLARAHNCVYHFAGRRAQRTSMKSRAECSHARPDNHTLQSREMRESERERETNGHPGEGASCEKMGDLRTLDCERSARPCALGWAAIRKDTSTRRPVRMQMPTHSQGYALRRRRPGDGSRM